MGKIIIGVVMLIVAKLTGCKKTEVVVIEAPTSVYEDYPESGPPTSKVIAVLNKGETAEFIHARYAKDCEYLKIRLKDGRTGYVGWNGKYTVPRGTR